MKEGKCPICGETFKIEHPNSKYCNSKCRLIARKRQIRRSDLKRRGSDERKDYMMEYMWEYRKHKYRQSALSTDKQVRGIDTPSVIYNDAICHDSKLMANSE